MTSDPGAKKAPAEPPAPQEDVERKKQERYELVSKILGKETFIDPLVPENITKAYAVYEKDPTKVIEVVTASFQSHCRKCIRESALIEIKNEISHSTIEEAERLKSKATAAVFDKIKSDPDLEQLLMMLIFKNQYWHWVRYGLRDIFTEQRTQPGHMINTYLNARFHRLKKKKGYRIIGDLVLSDITEIVNSFKNAVIKKRVRIFG